MRAGISMPGLSAAAGDVWSDCHTSGTWLAPPLRTVRLVAESVTSAASSRVVAAGRPLPVDEVHFAEIDAAMLYIEEARARAERAGKALRSDGADAHLIEALDEAQEQLSEVARALRQGTFFAVPAAQTTL
jgi:hypothetical protein